MEFNISQKTDPETEKSKFIVEGDKEFTTIIMDFIRGIKGMLLSMPYIINKRRENEKGNKPTNFPNVKTLKMDETLANKIIDNNPDLLDRIVLVKEVDDTVVGIRIK